ncbi:MAG TPA: hypothetical protein PKY59_05810, partial [Pyrinomonadaceae bacterium]|nr:hypothetical protein [Pyrinomonadaceae bacterium]
KLNLQTSSPIAGESWGISQGKIVPLKVGTFNSFAFYSFYLKISVIVKLNNREIIVSQDNILAAVKKDNK